MLHGSLPVPHAGRTVKEHAKTSLRPRGLRLGRSTWQPTDAAAEVAALAWPSCSTLRSADSAGGAAQAPAARARRGSGRRRRDAVADGPWRPAFALRRDALLRVRLHLAAPTSHPEPWLRFAVLRPCGVGSRSSRCSAAAAGESASAPCGAVAPARRRNAAVERCSRPRCNAAGTATSRLARAAAGCTFHARASRRSRASTRRAQGDA
jgi:hypothetical protein